MTPNNMQIAAIFYVCFLGACVYVAQIQTDVHFKVECRKYSNIWEFSTKFYMEICVLGQTYSAETISNGKIASVHRLNRKFFTRQIRLYVQVECVTFFVHNPHLFP